MTKSIESLNLLESNVKKLKSLVINLKKASDSIRLAISIAEKKAKVSLKKIHVIFEQPDFLCTRFSKHKKIDDSKIHRSDIEFLLNEAKKHFDVILFDTPPLIAVTDAFVITKFVDKFFGMKIINLSLSMGLHLI